MSGGFDQIAIQYDDEFSNSAIGKLQRQLVWNYLEHFLHNKHKLNILELNCGTGVDAIWLARKGHSVLATDISKEMIEVAKKKAGAEGLNDKISFSLVDLTKPETFPTGTKFDMVFSNFGGFNCIDYQSFEHAISGISRIMSPTGRLIAVIMPKFCLWESFYFTLKGKQSKVFRRNGSMPLKVPIGNILINTWYYSPSDVISIIRNDYQTMKKLPVGIFIPPSYLNSFFSKHLNFLNFLNRLENFFQSYSALAGASDHFIIDMEVKS